MQDHGGIGRDYVEEIYRDYGKVDTKDKDTLLTKSNTWSATEEILQHWNIALSAGELAQLKNDFFEKSWNRVTDSNPKLSIKDSYALLRDIMTPVEVPTSSFGSDQSS